MNSSSTSVTDKALKGSPVYLDCNATAPVRPEVIAGMAAVLGRVGNPSSIHGAGRAAKADMETARDRVLDLVGGQDQSLVFTSGGTEANYLAVTAARGHKVLVSAIEHASVLGAAPDFQFIPVTASGVVDLDALRGLLEAAQGPVYAMLMLANNETGVIQPVKDAARMVHEFGGLIHCDAIQAAGKIPVVFDELGVDSLSISAHKIGGPAGTGALVFRPDLAIAARVVGGGQERGYRAGTENLAGIVGLGVAAEMAAQHLNEAPKLAELRDDLERRVRAISNETLFIGSDVERLPNTSCLTMPGVPSNTQVMAMDLDGVMISAGSACSSGTVKRSHVLDAMGLTDRHADSTIRVSLGRDSNAHDVDRFFAAWEKIFRRIT